MMKTMIAGAVALALMAVPVTAEHDETPQTYSCEIAAGTLVLGSGLSITGSPVGNLGGCTLAEASIAGTVSIDVGDFCSVTIDTDGDGIFDTTLADGDLVAAGTHLNGACNVGAVGETLSATVTPLPHEE